MFGDPSYEYHAAAAKIWGGVAIHLADAPVLPFDYARTAADLSKYLSAIKAATPTLDAAVAALIADRYLERSAAVHA